MDDFFETDPGQFIAGSHRFIATARLVRYSEQAKWEGTMLLVPTLHLLAHGIELLFKYPHLRAGMTQREVAQDFGHDLEKLWSCERAGTLRALCILSGEKAWEKARTCGLYPNEDFSEDPGSALARAVVDLSHLHDRSSNFALRYGVKGPTYAPRSAYLIDTFGEVAYRTCLNPAYLD